MASLWEPIVVVDGYMFWLVKNNKWIIIVQWWTYNNNRIIIIMIELVIISSKRQANVGSISFHWPCIIIRLKNFSKTTNSKFNRFSEGAIDRSDIGVWRYPLGHLSRYFWTKNKKSDRRHNNSALSKRLVEVCDYTLQSFKNACLVTVLRLTSLIIEIINLIWLQRMFSFIIFK